MIRFLKIDEASKILGVSIQTLRRWEAEGYLVPVILHLSSGSKASHSSNIYKLS